MNNKLLALYGLKWNPFAPEVPTEALWQTPEVDHFCWRIETLAREGGFALVTGEPGSGKSVTLRLLSRRLSEQRDLKVGVLTRPHSSLADFYREMGDLFGLPLSPHNRWAGTRVLRECWQTHIETVLLRPVLLLPFCFWMRPSRPNPPCSTNCACSQAHASTPASCSPPCSRATAACSATFRQMT